MTNQVSFFEQKIQYELDAWDLAEALKRGENIQVIDTRSKESFEKEHIAGAINIHHRIMNSDTTENLDKNTLYVTYCTGVGCNASTTGALNLSKLGFKVKELIGGIAWWKREGYVTEGTQVTAYSEVDCGC